MSHGSISFVTYHRSTAATAPLSSQPLGAITSLVHYFSHDSAFNWVLAVCSLDGRTHKILRPLVLPSVFNWTVTGFVQGTKTNGSGPGQFRDVVRPRRVNLKAESQVVRVYVCRACVCIKTRKKIREKERRKNNCQTFICIVLLWIRTRDSIFIIHLTYYIVIATVRLDTADTYNTYSTSVCYIIINCHNTSCHCGV